MATNPNPIAAAPDNSGLTPDQAAVTKPLPPASPAPAQTQPVAPPPDPTAAKHNMIGKIFSTIAGNTKTVYDQTPQGPTPRQVPLQPGEVARTIVASAFSLLAAGAAGSHGKSIPQDITIGGMRQNQEEQANQQAQQQFKNKQSADAAARQADEQTLQHARFALDQQKAIGDMREQNERFKSESADLAWNQTERSRQTMQFASDQALRLKLDEEHGVVPATVNGSPAPKFINADGSIAQAQAQQYVTAHAKELAQNGFTVMPRLVLNPDGNWEATLVEHPKFERGQKYVGYEMNGDVPKLDANGDPIFNGKVKDSITHQPTGYQANTYQQLQELQLGQARIADAQISYQEHQTSIAKMQQEIQNNKESKDAFADYIQNGVEGMDPKNRATTLKDLIPIASAQQKAWTAAESTNGATSPEAIEARSDFLQTSKQIRELQTQTNAGVDFVNSLKRMAAHNGKVFTQQQIQQQIDAAPGLTKENKARATETNLGNINVDDIPDLLQNDKASAQEKLRRLSQLGQVRATQVIQASTLSDADKKNLAAAVQAQLAVGAAPVAAKSNTSKEQAITGAVESVNNFVGSPNETPEAKAARQSAEAKAGQAAVTAGATAPLISE